MPNRDTTYNDLPYSNNAFWQTHPAHLATMAALYGLQPPDIATCRVLELGCGPGGNLLPMAESLPRARFVGIDLSDRQIEMGRGDLAELGLANVELLPLSITDLDASFGRFDFINCHGVYSWVPPDVQARILQVCRDNLSENGVAYISYNTFPGWHFRSILREFARFHVDRSATIDGQLRQLAELLRFTHDGVADPDGVRSRVLRDEAQDLIDSEPRYVFHEILEPFNEPLYFSEFAERLDANRLQFVAEAIPYALIASLSDNIKGIADRWSSSRVRREQYDDFLTHRTFRRSLITHAAAKVSAAVAPAVLSRCRLTTAATPDGDVDLAPDVPVKFTNMDKVSITPSIPLMKAALKCLHESRPEFITFDALAQRVAAALQIAPAAAAASLPDTVIACYERGMIDLSLHPPQFVHQLSERPCASPAARLQARGDSRPTCRRHRGFAVDGTTRALLPFVDGTRTANELVELLLAQVQNGDMSIEDEQGQPLPPDEVRAYCQDAVAGTLKTLAFNAYLIA